MNASTPIRPAFFGADLKTADPAIAEAIAHELARQQERRGGAGGFRVCRRQCRRGKRLDLIDCARRIDLVVASPDGGAFLSTATLAISSGAPVLIAPEAPASAIGKHVLVAWNGSREAARALRASWPFLMAAEQVHVLVVSPGGLGGPDGFLQRHFEHHGVRPNLIVDPRDDASAGEIIRDQAGALAADLVVMGLYGRSRLKELILGGASREMLKHCAIPLLISH
eukprot:gene40485-54746_t